MYVYALFALRFVGSKHQLYVAATAVVVEEN